MDKSIFISVTEVKVKMIFVSLPRVYPRYTRGFRGWRIYLLLDKFAKNPGWNCTPKVISKHLLFLAFSLNIIFEKVIFIDAVKIFLNL